jgi:hypothetical protein
MNALVAEMVTCGLASGACSACSAVSKLLKPSQDRVQGGARRGQLDLAHLAFKECQAGVFLKHTDLVTDRRRRDRQFARGQLEAAMAGCRFESAQG